MDRKQTADKVGTHREALTWNKGLMLANRDTHKRPTAYKEFELPGELFLRMGTLIISR